MPDLLPLSDARERVLAHVPAQLGQEEIRLNLALGRVLASAVDVERDLPPFASSAMDGYAVRAGEEGELRVVDEARAGLPAAAAVEPGTAIAISTGAQVPAGAEAVIPVERTEPGADGSVRVPAGTPGQNIRAAGEDLRAGEQPLAAGTVLGPAELGVLASLGLAAVTCARRPRVAIVTTGDELVDPGEPLAPGQIHGSNATALAAQVAAAGGEVALAETVPDELDATRAALERALAGADVVCISGGVSVGPHDHVKPALAELGAEEVFWGVALKPGKPTWFGTRGDALVFGLPGNPVSAMVCFHLFARPALRALQGADPAATRGEAILDEPVRLSPGRAQAVRVRLAAGADGWHATPTGAQGSHRLSSMLGADALALVAPGDGELAAGERVEVELL